jgi:hypothetical protein
MRTIDKLTGEKAREAAEMLPPFGPGLERRIVNTLETLEILATDFRDSGGDYCEFRAYNRIGTHIATRRVRGY